MNQWGMKKMSKKISMLALAGAFVVGVAACGGGSSGSSSSASAGGGAIKGPLNSPTITSSSGTPTCTTTADGTGIWSCSVTDPGFPLIFTFSGGTDSVTGAAPLFPVKTAITSAASTVANALPQTTFAIDAAIAQGGTGFSAADLTTATSRIMSNYGGGMDANFDPFGTAISAANSAAILMGAESLGEIVRRTAANSTNSANASAIYKDIAKVLAQDVSDGTIDGQISSVGANGSSTIDATALAAIGDRADQIMVQAQSQLINVVGEMAQGTLTINGKTLAQVAAAMGNGHVTAANLTGFSVPAPLLQKAVAAMDAVTNSGLAVTAGNFTTLKNQFNAAIALAANGVVSSANLQAQISAAALTAVTNDIAANATTAAVAALTTTQTTAAAAAATITDSFKVDATAGTAADLTGIYLTDYPSNVATNVYPSTVSLNTTAGDANKGLLTVSATTALSASNLALLGSSSNSAAAATPPVLNITLTSLPVATGTATVTMVLVDGADATRDSGERYVSATYSVPYSSNGTTLTLTAPSTASVTYYSASATAASTATLTNASGALGSLLVTTAGTNQGSQSATLKAKIATLFNTASTNGNAALASAMANITEAGTYHYKVTLSGINISNGTNPITMIGGSFTTQ